MTWNTLNWFFLLLLISKSLAGLNVLSAVSNITSRPVKNILINTKYFIQIASRNGYKAEKHEVVTNDGYILTMFRIPPRDKCAKKTPILVMHGLLQAAECFFDSGADAPGFILAQECYDVWFGNVRGTYHSRRHEILNPDTDLEFWKFSVDEMGLYDIPAMVDYVLNATDTRKLIYIGYSQGGASFFIMNSEKPEYADKISLFIGLAPASREYNVRSVVYRAAAIAINSFKTPLEAAGVWEIASEGFPIQGALGSLCQVKLLAAAVCGLSSSVLDSPHPGSITPATEKMLYEHAPAGTSVRNMAKHGQAMTGTKFVNFDYGSELNLEIYGSTEPPEYDLRASRMPAVVFSGKSDHIVDPRDVAWAVTQLPNVLEFVIVDDPLWNHLDMTYSRYWRDSIFVKMKEYLNKYDDIGVDKTDEYNS